MVAFSSQSTTTLVVIALVATSRGVNAGPCGYGALCGRTKCDSATVAAYNAALPKLLACQEHAKPFYAATITEESQMREWCLGGACGEAFNDIVRFSDIEANVCELHYPSREEEVLNGAYYGWTCLHPSFNSAPFQAEMKARVEAARSGGTPTTPATSTPTPTTRPSTAAPTTTAPPSPITAVPRPEVTTASTVATTTRVPTNQTSSASADSGRDETEAVTTPSPASNKPPTPEPSTAKPQASSSATQLRATIGAVVCTVTILVVVNSN